MKKRLLYHLSLILVPITLLVITANYFVDPANIFNGRAYVSGIADILLKGHNVDQVANYDERALQEQIITRLSWRPEVVVLGSSRIMELGADFFPGKKVLNCGVSHANINDLLAITGLLDSTGRLPQEVVINLDPHLVCQGGTSEWESLSAYRDHYLKEIHAQEPSHPASLRLEKFYSLISFEYFEKSLGFVLQRKTKRFLDVGLNRPALYGRFSDGTICYPSSYACPDTLKVTGDAGVVGGREETTPDKTKLKQLSELLDFLAGRKIAVVFVMLPFHPQYYRKMDQRFPGMFNQYTRIFGQLALDRHIPIHGGFDANALGIPPSQFYDSWHCSRVAIKKVYNQF
jgi:hypothetical protein